MEAAFRPKLCPATTPRLFEGSRRPLRTSKEVAAAIAMDQNRRQIDGTAKYLVFQPRPVVARDPDVIA